MISITPPMCFNIENARRLLTAFDKALDKVSSGEDESEEPATSSVLGYCLFNSTKYTAAEVD